MIQLLTTFAVDKCSSFLSFPTWHKYLHDGGSCSNLSVDNINDVWLVVAACVEILLRVAGIFAVVFVMYGGFQYLTSQAEPDKVTKARGTIINALIGLAIAILASVIINFIASSIQ